ncbi:MAG TPA: DUF2059 domain-containing protein [Flavisolibacter sp.]|jgi:hypothetical protein|nr:DUF2059 domain-containing protein [Flavisolibacter sp.]
MKRILLVLALIISAQGFAQNTSSPSIAHAKELLVAMGTAKNAKQVIEMMVASYKQNMPEVPTIFWDEFEKELSMDELIDLVAPIYAKYYTDDELVQLTAFYRSPLGQKLTDKLPVITQESFAAGQEWGKKIGEKVVVKLKEKGYLKD